VQNIEIEIALAFLQVKLELLLKQNVEKNY